AVTVDPPQKVKIQKLDRSELAGMITSYDDTGVQVMDANKQTQTITWDELPAEQVMTLHERLVRKATAEDWFKLGKQLLTMPGGRAPAERAFGKALRLDPKMKDQIVAARKEAGATQPTRAIPSVSVTPLREGAPRQSSAQASEAASTQPSGI